MSKRKVIVKRLNAIQNFGAMDILCTDKTGTLTEGKVSLIKHVDLQGHDSAQVLTYAYLNSFYQTGLKNLLDQAVLQHDTARAQAVERQYKKVDEVPFDFVRRRMSVVVEDEAGKHLLICKGAVEEVLAQSSRVFLGGRSENLSDSHHQSWRDLVTDLSQEGFRLIALGIRELPPTKRVYTVADEVDLTLVGFLAFLDPAKTTATQALKDLAAHGVQVKVLTGDNELVTRKLCREVGLPIKRILLGSEVAKLSDVELEQAAEEASVFDKLEPAHKERVIRALKRRGHVVGFMGDGINDAPALKAADVGISVDSAVDIAKESSDIILLEKSLRVLKDGVREGRRVFGNIDKYIKMTASSNFGNMLSVVGASLFLPFLPMLPIQVIANNLLYDLSQVAIPTDGVDKEYLDRPRPWNLKHIERFILIMGPVSSLFDYATYAILIFYFGAWAGNPELFHTGWFVESLLTQTFIIHVLRTNRLPFIKSRASWPLTLTTCAAVAVGLWLPFSPFASSLGFVPLPLQYWLFMVGLLVVYGVLAQAVKGWFRRYVEPLQEPAGSAHVPLPRVTS
jgi:Mg2+-importing ATPase